jgi:hypothetical protein
MDLGSLNFCNVRTKFRENRPYGLEFEVYTDVHTAASWSHDPTFFPFKEGK